MKFERWRYRGRHRGRRGCFPDYYRSVEAFDAADQWTAELIELLDRDCAAHIEVAQRNHLRMFLPAGPPGPEILWAPLGGNKPTLVFDTEPPRDRSGWKGWEDFTARTLDWHADVVAMMATLWLPGDELDDDEQAIVERLMGMAGA